MYYRAEIYKGSVVKHSFIAGSIDELKIKAKPFINDTTVTQITVSKVEDIGYFKVPFELEEYLKCEML